VKQFAAILVVGDEEVFSGFLERFPAGRYAMLFAVDEAETVECLDTGEAFLVVMSVAGVSPKLSRALRQSRTKGSIVLGLSMAGAGTMLPDLADWIVPRDNGVEVVAEATRELLEERRRWPRAAIQLPLQIGPASPATATIVSARSLFVPTPRPLKMGEQLQLEFEVDAGEPLRSRATVVRIGRGDSGQRGVVFAIPDGATPICTLLDRLVRDALRIEHELQGSVVAAPPGAETEGAAAAGAPGAAAGAPAGGADAESTKDQSESTPLVDELKGEIWLLKDEAIRHQARLAAALASAAKDREELEQERTAMEERLRSLEAALEREQQRVRAQPPAASAPADAAHPAPPALRPAPLQDRLAQLRSKIVKAGPSGSHPVVPPPADAGGAAPAATAPAASAAPPPDGPAASAAPAALPPHAPTRFGFAAVAPATPPAAPADARTLQDFAAVGQAWAARPDPGPTRSGFAAAGTAEGEEAEWTVVDHGSPFGTEAEVPSLPPGPDTVAVAMPPTESGPLAAPPSVPFTPPPAAAPVTPAPAGYPAAPPFAAPPFSAPPLAPPPAAPPLAPAAPAPYGGYAAAPPASGAPPGPAPHGGYVTAPPAPGAPAAPGPYGGYAAAPPAADAGQPLFAPAVPPAGGELPVTDDEVTAIPRRRMWPFIAAGVGALVVLGLAVVIGERVTRSAGGGKGAVVVVPTAPADSAPAAPATDAAAPTAVAARAAGDASAAPVAVAAADAGAATAVAVAPPPEAAPVDAGAGGRAAAAPADAGGQTPAAPADAAAAPAPVRVAEAPLSPEAKRKLRQKEREGLLRRGYELIEKNDQARAREMLTRALKMGDDPAVRDLLALSHRRSGELWPAAHHMEKAAASSGGAARARRFVNLGALYAQLGKRADACKAYRAALSAVPTYAPAQKQIDAQCPGGAKPPGGTPKPAAGAATRTGK
jgi:hypothetical protein